MSVQTQCKWMTAEQEKKPRRALAPQRRLPRRAHNAYASINKPKTDTVDPNFHNWGYKTSCLKLNLESDNRMTRAESAGGKSKTKGPYVTLTKIILLGLLHFLDFEWLMQHSFVFL